MLSLIGVAMVMMSLHSNKTLTKMAKVGVHRAALLAAELNCSPEKASWILEQEPVRNWGWGGEEIPGPYISPVFF